MIAPHTEACEVLARTYDPALIIPTDHGAWGQQDGIKVSLRYNPREALTDWAWSAIAQIGTMSACVHHRHPTAAMNRAVDGVVQRADAPIYPSRAQQVAEMEHERRIAGLPRHQHLGT